MKWNTDTPPVDFPGCSTSKLVIALLLNGEIVKTFWCVHDGWREGAAVAGWMPLPDDTEEVLQHAMETSHYRRTG